MKLLRSAIALLLAAAMLALAAGCAGSAKRESTGEFIDDSAITTKVKASFVDDPALKVLEIKVATFRGVVQLSGFVESRQIAERAVQVARGVPGVRAVRDDMRVGASR